MVSERKFLFIGAAAVALALVYLVKKKGAAAAAGQALGGAVVDAAGGVVSGVALGVGDSIGIPRTDMTACQQAIADGRTWDASFACPASDFFKYVTGQTP